MCTSSIPPPPTLSFGSIRYYDLPFSRLKSVVTCILNTEPIHFIHIWISAFISKFCKTIKYCKAIFIFIFLKRYGHDKRLNYYFILNLAHRLPSDQFYRGRWVRTIMTGAPFVNNAGAIQPFKINKSNSDDMHIIKITHLARETASHP